MACQIGIRYFGPLSYGRMFATEDRIRVCADDKQKSNR